MRHIFTIIFLSFSLLLSGQNCVEGNVYLTNQAAVDNFVIAHSTSGCTTINGILYVGGSVNDISGLSFLTTINGDLFISGAALTSLTGLQNITAVNDISIEGTSTLTNVSALSSISSVDKLRMRNLTALSNISDLHIEVADIELNNVNIPDFGGITFAANLQEIDIRNMPSLASIGNFSTVNYVNFEIHLENLLITSLAGLENLTSVIGEFHIGENPNLTDISQLSSLVYTRGLFISENTALDECCVINRIFTNELALGGPLSITDNNTNCMNVGSVITICAPIVADGDNDRVPDNLDNCPDMDNITQIDTDGDGVGDSCDNCPGMANASQADANGDGIGDICQSASGGFGASIGGIGINTTEPHSLLEVADGDVFINNINRGVIMKTASGKCFRYQPSETGALQGKELTCPDN